MNRRGPRNRSDYGRPEELPDAIEAELARWRLLEPLVDELEDACPA